MILSDSDLLSAWEAAEGTTTRAEFAAQYGMKPSQLNNRLFLERERRKNSPENIDNAERVNVTRDGAYTMLESKSRRIKTLDDLVAACEIDLSKFAVERWTANKWEVGISDKNGGVIVEPLFQVKATLLPKHPEGVFLSINPVRIDAKPLKVSARARKTSGRGLVIPDTQIGFRKNQMSGALEPFHDRAAMDVVLQIAQAGEYDHICFLGDYLDLNDWSDKFLKEPEFYFTTQPAIYEGHWWLAQFRAAQPKARITKLEGNHENRIPKMLITHLLAAHGLTSALNVGVPVMGLPHLLDLPALGVEFLDHYPHNEDWMVPVRLIHGDVARSGAGDTVKAVSQHAQETVIQGHIHRIEWASRTIKSKQGIQTIAAFSPGCLCRVDYTVPGHQHPQQWQQGAAEVDWNGDNYQITPVVINNGKAVHRGRVYEARDALATLNRDTDKIRNGWRF